MVLIRERRRSCPFGVEAATLLDIVCSDRKRSFRVPVVVRNQLILLLLFLDSLCFVADLALPKGWVIWVLYLIPCILALFGPSKLTPLIQAGLSILLTWIGYLGSPDSGLPESMVVVNRLIGSASFLATGIFGRVFVQKKILVEQLDWIRAGQNEIHEAIRGDLTLTELSAKILNFLVFYTNAKAGVFFARRRDESVVREATFGVTKDKLAAPKTLSPKEGLAWEAAETRKILEITDPPKGYLPFGSGLGKSDATHIMIIPFCVGDQVCGVCELGFIGPPKGIQHRFFDAIKEAIALTLRSARDREIQSELLHETQQQAEELKSQQEALHETNEDLRQKSEELKTQQEDLSQKNEELQQQQATLEEQKEQVEETNRALEETKDMLEKRTEALISANRYKSEFLANMSHELRTPLNSILILAKLVSEGKVDSSDELSEMGGTIHASAADLLSLINDILDLSKIEAGRLEARPQEVMIARVADSLGRHFRPQAQPKGISFEVVFEEEAPERIITDKTRLEQILRNFLSNAFKFTEVGEVVLQFRKPTPREMKDDAPYLAIEVSDTGIGISDDKQGLIFEAFQQGDGSVSRKFGGTGLGLTISRELANLLGGRIAVQSAVGRGSSFTLFLPEHIPVRKDFGDDQTATSSASIFPPKEERDETQPPEEKSQSKHPSQTLADDRENLGLNDKRVLIIEDDPSFSKILANLCRKKGFKCIHASTGEAGLEDAMRFLPHGIILDIRLPGKSGITVLNELKRDPKTRHIPVEVLSVEDVESQVLKMGAVGFVSKPMTSEELDEALDVIETQMHRTAYHVLIVEDNEVESLAIQKLIGNGIVKSQAVSSAEEALGALMERKFDCIILDLKLANSTGFELLETLSRNCSVHLPPVIVYTGKDLSKEEEEKLEKYSECIIIKGAKSPERLLNEVTLFLHRIEEELPKEQQAMLESVRHREDIFDGKKILVVDDDMRSVFALRNVLRKRGFELMTAKNGKEALDILERHPNVDLVLMDIMMPEMDGLEATRRIRARRDFQRLPVIALTAKAMKGDREKCLEAGANDYLSKPIDTDNLISLLRIWLTR